MKDYFLIMNVIFVEVTISLIIYPGKQLINDVFLDKVVHIKDVPISLDKMSKRSKGTVYVFLIVADKLSVLTVFHPDKFVLVNGQSYNSIKQLFYRLQIACYNPG